MGVYIWLQGAGIKQLFYWNETRVSSLVSLSTLPLSRVDKMWICKVAILMVCHGLSWLSMILPDWRSKNKNKSKKKKKNKSKKSMTYYGLS